MNRFFALLIAFLGGALVYAQHVEIPNAVKNAYSSKYVAKATFGKRGNLYVAEFIDKGVNLAAYYAEDGTWAKTEKVVSFESLKEAIRTEINKRFLGEGSRYSLDKALEIETPGGMFEAARFFMEGGGTITIYFNPDGTMVKREVVQ
ncbi:MAG: hypothetical protein N2167_06740 [Flavobacteriales bacterium]|nr:hypothetical protein [Flavobacteriales bacterium]